MAAALPVPMGAASFVLVEPVNAFSVAATLPAPVAAFTLEQFNEMVIAGTLPVPVGSLYFTTRGQVFPVSATLTLEQLNSGILVLALLNSATLEIE